MPGWPRSRILCLAACLPVGLVLSACRAPSPEHGAGLPGSPPLRHARSIAATHLWPQTPGPRQFSAIVDGEAPIPVASQTSPRDPGWRETTGSWSSVDIVVDGDGALTTAEEHDLRNRVIVRYNPPLVLLPGRLVLNEAASGQSQVHVTNQKNDATRDRGTCRYDVVLAGRQRVETPAGAFDAYIVKTTRVLDLNLAHATVTWWSAYVPRKGLVAQYQTEEVRIMKLFPTTRTIDLRLDR